ncbi:MAG: topoisomerase C-terminal repeat-containing protein [Planctomycetaceae bacterium]
MSETPRQYTTTSKGAQEAHEAIRPAGTEMKTAEELGLSDQQAKLYALIWKRTIATQMAEARLTFQTVTITSHNAEFRATGRHVDFPGFFRAYVEGVDDAEAVLDDQDSTLPPLEEKTALNCQELETVFHETKPPARFTEATLIRKLEAEGIGRPSTYSAIIGTIQDRGYVRKANNQLIPTYTAMAVTRLLESYFPRLVDYKFTADMEQELDEIATGSRDRLPYLERFYAGKDGLDEQVKSNEESIDPREACTLHFDGIKANIRVGRYGPYLEDKLNGEDVTASIPEDVAPADITNEKVTQLIQDKQAGPQSLGIHPEEGLPIYILKGPFGPYLQLGDVVEGEAKPKRVGIPKNLDLTTLTLPTALELISLPKDLGNHPETGKKVTAGIGRFGPYVLHDKVYKSLGKEDNILTIGLNQAVELLKQARVKQVATPLRELGPHPEDGEQIGVFEGRYGPYVKHGKILATVPKDTPLETITLAQALDWIAEKAARGGGTKRGKKSAVKKKTTTATRTTKASTTTKKKTSK